MWVVVYAVPGGVSYHIISTKDVLNLLKLWGATETKIAEFDKWQQMSPRSMVFRAETLTGGNIVVVDVG